MSQSSGSSFRSRGRGRGQGDRGGRGGGGGGQRGGGPRGGGPSGYQGAGGGPGHQGGQGFAPGGRGGGAPPPPSRGGGRGGRGRGGPQPGDIFSPPGGGALTLPDRLSPQNLDALVASFKQARVGPEMPLRPGWGTKGKPILLRANFFAVTLPKGLVIYEYEIKYVEQAPQGRKAKQKLPGAMQAQVLAILEEMPAFQPYKTHIAHDRRTRLVSSRRLPEDVAFDVVFVEEGDTAPRADASTFHVTLELKSELNTNELTQAMEGNLEHRSSTLDNPQSTGERLSLISALNLVLQQHAARTGTRVGKNRYFFATGNNADPPLSLGLYARQGFFLSVRPTFKQLMVNINVCMTAFYEPGNLAQAMFAFQEKSRGGMPNAFVEKLVVVTHHLGYRRKYTVRKVASNTASRQMMNLEEEGRQVSVEQYFREKYNVNLQYGSQLPLVDVTGPGARHTTYLPPELCEIPPNQAYHGLLDSTSTAAMIKLACKNPAFNADAIVNQGLPLLGLKQNAVAGPVAGFGLAVSNDMAVIPARILAPPSVAYRAGKPNIRDAGWNIVNVKFHAGGDMRNWAVLLVTEGRTADRGRPNEFTGNTDPQLKTFVGTFLAKCASSGMVTAPPGTMPQLIVTPRLPPHHRQDDPYRERALAVIKKALKDGLNPQRKPAFILVLLSGMDDYIYPGIKRMCDVELGLQTVSMLMAKARNDDANKQDQYFSNVALKVNVKLGGTNHVLDTQSMAYLKAKKTMMVGMDVTHPSPRSRKGTPSVVAVVASIDDDFIQYPASLGIQRNANINREAEEMVQDLDKMVVEKLLLYQKQKSNNNRLPERIIVFRDGVSDGQFRLVLRHELPQFHQQNRLSTIWPDGAYQTGWSLIISHHPGGAAQLVTILSSISSVLTVLIRTRAVIIITGGPTLGASGRPCEAQWKIYCPLPPGLRPKDLGLRGANAI
ncbi:hypothetical protein EIP91_001871 [Steccherinum ochraceum]|uniref:Piwi domain-containing protein n=1 Tax=Steccherinum ochraceum TaxID=92696 RepID=A0A4R0RGZ5_9APHY|nr:hypothetical protein EIP91_001871 [Steccherinum ochraceum]